MAELKGFVETPDGTKRCPTEKCGAICCTIGNPFGKPDGVPISLEQGPCEFLRKDCLCDLEVRGSEVYKPTFCSLWPTNQGDIDGFNREHAKGERRCYLYFDEDAKNCYLPVPRGN